MTKSIDDSAAILLAALTGRLDAEAARESAEIDAMAADMASSHPDQDARSLAVQIRDERAQKARTEAESQAVKLLQFDRACSTCRGQGYLELRERADVRTYRVIVRRGQLPGEDDQVRFVEPPEVITRTCCARCAGRSRTLNAAGRSLLENLVRILRDEIGADAANIDAFNRQARTTLAERAKAHEAERRRHEEADEIEREAIQRASAIREGKAPVEPAVRK